MVVLGGNINFNIILIKQLWN